LKYVAFPVPEIIGGTLKNGQSLDTPTLRILFLYIRAKSVYFLILIEVDTVFDAVTENIKNFDKTCPSLSFV